MEVEKATVKETRTAREPPSSSSAAPSMGRKRHENSARRPDTRPFKESKTGKFCLAEISLMFFFCFLLPPPSSLLLCLPFPPSLSLVH